jgi:preprotein translocase subunit SecD
LLRSPLRRILVLAGAAIVVLAFAVGVVYATRDPATHHGGRDGTAMTIAAVMPSGSAPDAGELDRARGIIETRARTAGFGDVRVVVDGRQNVVVTVGGTDVNRMRMLVSPAKLRFRLVLDTTPDAGPKPDVETPSPGSGTPGSSGPSGGAAATATGSGGTPGPSRSAGPSAGPPADSSPEARRAGVIAKLGAAYQVAEQIQDPSQLDDQTVALLAPFGLLTPEEVATLPATIQFKVPAVTCEQLLRRRPGAIEAADQQVVACELSDTASIKYLLDRAKVVGEDVAKASAHNVAPAGWAVTVQFTAAGQDRWTRLTTEASQDGAQRQVAVVLDNSVVAAPAILSTIPGDAEIAADFTHEQAQTFASVLQSGALPLTFSIVSIDRVRIGN